MTLRGCTVGEEVSFTVQGDSATATCNAPIAGVAGEARFVPIPGTSSATANLVAPTNPGVYLVVASGATSGLTDSAELTVVAPAATVTIPVTR